MVLQYPVKKISVRNGRTVIRLSLNPLLYEKSRRIVRWRIHDPGMLHPADLIGSAMQKYPRHTVSHAVEACLVDLMCDAAQETPAGLTAEEMEHLARFEKLSLLEKINITRKGMRLARHLKKLPWDRHEKRRRV